MMIFILVGIFLNFSNSFSIYLWLFTDIFTALIGTSKLIRTDFLLVDFLACLTSTISCCSCFADFVYQFSYQVVFEERDLIPRYDIHFKTISSLVLANFLVAGIKFSFIIPPLILLEEIALEKLQVTSAGELQANHEVVMIVVNRSIIPLFEMVGARFCGVIMREDR